MKKLMVPMLGLLLTYLIGSFAAASFDIREWDSYGRVMVACFMPLAAGLAYAVAYGSV